MLGPVFFVLNFILLIISFAAESMIHVGIFGIIQILIIINAVLLAVDEEKYSNDTIRILISCLVLYGISIMLAIFYWVRNIYVKHRQQRIKEKFRNSTFNLPELTSRNV